MSYLIYTIHPADLNSKPSLDEPCCTFITHGICGIWGMLAVGIFAKVLALFLMNLSRYLLWHG